MAPLRVEFRPGEVIAWEEFLALPAPAIALDGYVPGPPRRVEGHWSCNHHEEVDRFATRATCEQVALAIRFGGLSAMRRLGTPTVYANHADEDVCLAVWLLRRPDVVGLHHVDRLIVVESLMDSTGGCAVGVAGGLVDALGWIFEPYWEQMPTTADEMAEVTSAVGRRLDRFAATGVRPRAGRHWAGFEILARRGRIAVVHEISPHARQRYRDTGIDLFVSVRRHRRGTLDVSVGRTSPFVPADLRLLWDRLNGLEPPAEPPDPWGGGDLVGGSPRRRGTSLPLRSVLDETARLFPALAGPSAGGSDHGVLSAVARASAQLGPAPDPPARADEPVGRDTLFGLGGGRSRGGGSGG